MDNQRINPNPTGLKISARVEADIREQIRVLEHRLQFRKTRNRDTVDAMEVAKLKDFLKSLGLTVAVATIALAPLTYTAHAQEGYGTSDNMPIAGPVPCGPNMDSETCLHAIETYYGQCIAHLPHLLKRPNAITAEQALQCVHSAVVQAGADDIFDPLSSSHGGGR